jgi:hypothetical protein
VRIPAAHLAVPAPRLASGGKTTHRMKRGRIKEMRRNFSRIRLHGL